MRFIYLIKGLDGQLRYIEQHPYWFILFVVWVICAGDLFCPQESHAHDFFQPLFCEADLLFWRVFQRERSLCFSPAFPLLGSAGKVLVQSFESAWYVWTIQRLVNFIKQWKYMTFLEACPLVPCNGRRGETPKLYFCNSLVPWNRSISKELHVWLNFWLEAVWPACRVRHERAGWIRDSYERAISDLI